MLPVFPLFIEQREAQSLGVEAGAVVGDHLPLYADFAVGDQFTAPFARAYALRLQDAIQSHSCHGGTVPEDTMYSAP